MNETENEECNSAKEPLLNPSSAEVQTKLQPPLSSRGSGRGARKIAKEARQQPDPKSEQEDEDLIPQHVKELVLKLEARLLEFVWLSGLIHLFGWFVLLSTGDEQLMMIWGMGLLLSLLHLGTQIIPVILNLFQDYDPFRSFVTAGCRRASACGCHFGVPYLPQTDSYFLSLQQDMFRDGKELMATLLGSGVEVEDVANVSHPEGENEGNKTDQWVDLEKNVLSQMEKEDDAGNATNQGRGHKRSEG